MTGFVYFMQAGDGGAIKIGFTGNASIAGRLRGVQVGCPEKVSLLGVVAGDAALERRFHKAFAWCRIRGEWFAPRPRLVKFIQRAARHPDDHQAPLPSGLSALQELRWAIDHNWSRRRDCAAAAGIGEAHLSNILSGEQSLAGLPFVTAVRLAETAGIPIERLAEAISVAAVFERSAA